MGRELSDSFSEVGFVALHEVIDEGEERRPRGVASPREEDEADAGRHGGGERLDVGINLRVEGNFMMRTVMKSRPSRSTRSLAISTMDTRWPGPGHGMNTSSILALIKTMMPQKILLFLTEFTRLRR